MAKGECGTATAGVDPALVVTDAMIAVDHELSHLPASDAMQLIAFCRRRLDATEARILADRYEAGASDRDVEDLAGDDKTSKATAKKRARRAKAANANPDIADRMKAGDLSAEQADVIAQAAEETDGAAACDTELIDEIAGSTPEQGKKKAREFVNRRTSADDVQNRFDRQKRRRGVYRHRLPNGNSALTIHGPDEEIDDIERKFEARSDQLYQEDGGRVVPRAKHPRTRDQRNYDAAYSFFTEAGPAEERATTKRRAIVFVTATVDQLTGVDTSPMTGIDGKPLPLSLVEELAGDAAFIAQVFAADGELLWQGRRTRLATPAQINGLISRDKGCVQCGAHPDRCVAHHILPWEAPRKGRTNINNLVLLCHDCHNTLHAKKRSIFYDIGARTWRVRPATVDEIPVDRHERRPKPPPGRYAATLRVAWSSSPAAPNVPPRACPSSLGERSSRSDRERPKRMSTGSVDK